MLPLSLTEEKIFAKKFTSKYFEASPWFFAGIMGTAQTRVKMFS